MSNLNEFHLIAVWKPLTCRDKIRGEQKVKAYLDRIKMQPSFCLLDYTEAKDFAWFNAVLMNTRHQRLEIGSMQKWMSLDLKTQQASQRGSSLHCKSLAQWRDCLVVGENSGEISLWLNEKELWRHDAALSIQVHGCGDDHVVGFEVLRDSLFYVNHARDLVCLDLKAVRLCQSPPPAFEKISRVVDSQVAAFSTKTEGRGVVYIKGQQLMRNGSKLADLKLEGDKAGTFSRVAGSRSWIVVYKENFTMALLTRLGELKHVLDLEPVTIERDSRCIKQLAMFEKRGVQFVAASYQSNLGALLAVNSGKLVPLKVGFDVQVEDKVSGCNSVFGFLVLTEPRNKKEFSLIFHGYSILNKIKFKVV